jgi:hypothetical protein
MTIGDKVVVDVLIVIAPCYGSGDDVRGRFVGSPYNNIGIRGRVVKGTIR